MTNPSDIAALVGRLRELLARATPGQWEAYSEPEVGLPTSLFVLEGPCSRRPLEPMEPHDIDLVIEAKAALPTLLAEIERLNEALAKIVDLWPYDDWFCEDGPGSATDIARSALRAERADMPTIAYLVGAADHGDEVKALRDALTRARDQFAFYAREHSIAGKIEKANTNLHYVAICDTALAKGTPSHE